MYSELTPIPVSGDRYDVACFSDYTFRKLIWKANLESCCAAILSFDSVFTVRRFDNKDSQLFLVQTVIAAPDDKLHCEDG
jgi:hypothetical protein